MKSNSPSKKEQIETSNLKKFVLFSMESPKKQSQLTSKTDLLKKAYNYYSSNC